MIKGIDISGYQRYLDFAKAKSNGVEVCIIKASEDTIYGNSYLDSQVKQALSQGMKIGFYHFFRNKGQAEAEYFVNTIKPYKDKMKVKPVIDIESSYSYNEVITFINYVEKALGAQCMVYCNYSYAKQLSLNSEIAKRPLWLAYYGTNDGNYYTAPGGHGFKTYAGQQYSDQNYIGNVNVDMNYFNENIYINEVNKLVTKKYDGKFINMMDWCPRWRLFDIFSNQLVGEINPKGNKGLSYEILGCLEDTDKQKKFIIKTSYAGLVYVLHWEDGNSSITSKAKYGLNQPESVYRENEELKEKIEQAKKILE